MSIGHSYTIAEDKVWAKHGGGVMLLTPCKLAQEMVDGVHPVTKGNLILILGSKFIDCESVIFLSPVSRRKTFYKKKQKKKTGVRM